MLDNQGYINIENDYKSECKTKVITLLNIPEIKNMEISNS